MKGKYNKVIAKITLMIMIMTMVLPITAYAAPPVSGPDYTFNEADENDGSIAGQITVDMGATWGIFDHRYNSYSLSGQVPGGLQLRVEKDGNDAAVSFRNKAVNHDEIDSVSITLTFYYTYILGSGSVNKTFNIIFKDNEPEGVEDPGDAGKPGAYTDDDAPPETLTRDKIHILEVYPSKIGYGSEYRDAYDKYRNDNDVEITSISLNSFISLKDEVNGKYDIVYFGKGRYFRNAVTEHRYGNDITERAAEKVKEFIDADQLCVFHEDAFKVDNVDQDDDVESIMKEELHGYINRSNVIVVNDGTKANVINNFKNTYKDHNQRPILEVTEYPLPYDEEDGQKASNKLSFSFKVYDPDMPINEKLKVALYIDRNNDSLFKDNAEVDEVVYSQGDIGERYTLEVMNGRSGTIIFNMPSKLTGVYFWKLAVVDSNNAKCEKEDVFKLVGDEITVDVLQIMPNNGGNLNLESKFNEHVSGKPWNVTYGEKPDEYKINVETMTVSQFKQKADSNNAQFIDDLQNKYDMLILGFDDNYTNQELPLSNSLVELNQPQSPAIELIREFIDTKKSVMFTHDTIHFQYNDDLTYNFMDDVGQMLVLENGSKISDDDMSKQGVWTAGLLGFDANIPTPMDYEYNNYLRDDYDLQVYQSNNPNNTATLVKPVNSTAVTLYPFNLENVNPNQRRVSGTHYQWRKLNLEDPDVIPLFNLYNTSNNSGRINDDSMNNYYTYTKDSITYSGTGHSGNYPEYEIKLFVNTAIKAYSMGNHAPDITVIKPQDGDKIPLDEDTFELEFSAYDIDLGDDTLNYRVLVDYTDDGVENFVALEQFEHGYLEMINGASVELELDNRTEVGRFSVRMEVRDRLNAGTYKDITLYTVDEPLITPEIEVYKGGSQITECLVGENVTAKLKFKVTGRAESEQATTPTYELVEEYSNPYDNEPPYTIAAGDLETVTFKVNENPTPPSITRDHNFTIDTGLDEAVLSLSTSVDYKVNGITESGNDSTSVNVRNGQVEVYVVDAEGNKVGNVTVKDADTSLEIGQTDVNGYLLIDKVYGPKNYTIESPAGYIYNGTFKISKYNEDNSKVLMGSGIDLTYDDYRWEVVFEVENSLGMQITYYKLNADKTNIDEVIGTALAPGSDPYMVKNHKNTQAQIVAKVEVDPMASGSLNKIVFNIETKDSLDNSITSGDYAAVISSGPDNLDSTVPDLNGLSQLKDINVIGSGSYDGQTYYLVIDVSKTNTQKIKITKAIMTINGTDYEVEFNKGIQFEETTAPLLR